MQRDISSSSRWLTRSTEDAHKLRGGNQAFPITGVLFGKGMLGKEKGRAGGIGFLDGVLE